MKKIIHKLKKNRLVSKIASLLTICMILVSSFTVSSFAVDEEEASNSITDVWTGVTDSIMSLLGTAQGVFVSSDYSPLLYGPGIEIGTLNFYPILNFPDANVGDVIPFSINDEGVIISNSFIISDSGSGELGFSASKYALIVDESETLTFAFFDPVVDGLSYDGWYCWFLIPVSIPGSSSLTFLGTLAIVCVSIALIMLLVYVISRFFRLRG